MLFSTPPSRVELQTSPYPQYSQHQLDMRRKAEILRYNSNTQSTQTNSLTKAEKWGQLISGKYQPSAYPQIIGTTTSINPTTGKYSYSQYINKITTVDCSSDELIPTPTSSCGIPGPITYLIRDVKVPLYNFATNVDAYAILPPPQTPSKWKSYISSDIAFYNGMETGLFTLSIGNSIDESAYTYNVQVPIGFFFYGTDISDTQLNKHLMYSDNVLNVPSDFSSLVDMNVYYNGDALTLSRSPVISITNVSTRIIGFDISFTPIYTNDNYSGTLYYGLLNIQNLYLPTRAGFVYDIKLTFNLPSINEVNIDNNVIQFNSYGVLCNLSESNIYKQKNCTFTFPATSPSANYSPFLLTGI
jgi:hypothetical protein